VFFYNASLALLSYASVVTATGYIAAWEPLAGYVTVPAGAAYALVFVCTLPGEAPTGYWDVDTFLIQNVTAQTGNSQLTTMAPASLMSDYSALRALSNIDSSYSSYGKALWEIMAADGVSASQARTISGQSYIQVTASGGLSPTYAEMNADTNLGGHSFLTASSSGGAVTIESTPGGGVSLTIGTVGNTINISVGGSVGYTGPVAGRSAKNGIII
jgi:hypothetical protein